MGASEAGGRGRLLQAQPHHEREGGREVGCPHHCRGGQWRGSPGLGKTWPALEEPGWDLPTGEGGGAADRKGAEEGEKKGMEPLCQPPSQRLWHFFSWDCHIFLFFFWTGQARGRSFSFCGAEQQPLPREPLSPEAKLAACPASPIPDLGTKAWRGWGRGGSPLPRARMRGGNPGSDPVPPPRKRAGAPGAQVAPASLRRVQGARPRDG